MNKSVKLGAMLLGLCMSGIAMADGAVNIKNGLGGVKIRWTINAEDYNKDFLFVVDPDKIIKYTGTLGSSDEMVRVKSLASDKSLRSLKLEWLTSNGEAAYTANFDFRDRNLGSSKWTGGGVHASTDSWDFDCAKSGCTVSVGSGKNKAVLTEKLTWD